MRLNLQGWNSLSLDGMAIEKDLQFVAWALLRRHLGPLRVKGVAELGLFWISSGEKRARPSSVLGIRYYPSRCVWKCRLMLAPTGRTVRARSAQYLRDMLVLILEVLVAIEVRLHVDLAKRAAALRTGFETLVRQYT